MQKNKTTIELCAQPLFCFVLKIKKKQALSVAVLIKKKKEKYKKIKKSKLDKKNKSDKLENKGMFKRKKK